MKKVALFGSVLALALAMTGCKSDLDKYADDLCECKDMACAEGLKAKYGDKLGGGKKDTKLEELSEAEQKAAKRIVECSLKLMK